jgi:CO/xanthine dehydrogenase FAD-binding subunit
MQAFEYERPTSLADAEVILGDNEGAKLLAGGQTLLPTMKQGTGLSVLDRVLEKDRRIEFYKRA